MLIYNIVCLPYVLIFIKIVLAIVELGVYIYILEKSLPIYTHTHSWDFERDHIDSIIFSIFVMYLLVLIL